MIHGNAYRQALPFDSMLATTVSLPFRWLPL